MCALFHEHIWLMDAFYHECPTVPITLVNGIVLTIAHKVLLPTPVLSWCCSVVLCCQYLDMTVLWTKNRYCGNLVPTIRTSAKGITSQSHCKYMPARSEFIPFSSLSLIANIVNRYQCIGIRYKVYEKNSTQELG